MRLLEPKISRGSCGEIRNRHTIGNYTKTTSRSNILRSREGIWDYLEVWYHEWHWKADILTLWKFFFFSDRKFWVYIGSNLSNIQNRRKWVPQRSILSVTIFSIKINIITNYLNPVVDKYLFIHDFSIISTFKYMHKAELQLGIKIINKWAMINGFKIAKIKTQCVHFCQLRKMNNNPTLNMDGSEIPVVD